MKELNYLAVIPARAGSKGIPHKNIKLLAGMPLILYTIQAAKEVFQPGEICISTDSEQIKSIAESEGISVPFLRPSDISGDSTSMEEVLNHVVSLYKESGININSIVLLQPTSPFRTATHIQEALRIFEMSEDQIDMVVTVKVTDANPYFKLYEEDAEGNLRKVKIGNFDRRQDCPRVLEVNGAIYVIKVDSLLKKGMKNFTKIKAMQMDKKSSVDIDDQIDWTYAEALIEHKNISHVN